MADRVRTGYSGAQISLHWIIAALVIFQLIFGEDMSKAIKATERGVDLSPSQVLWADVHYYVGIAILVLILLRLTARFTWGAPPLLQQGWMRSAARTSHAAFYVLLLAAPGLGLLAYYLGNPFGGMHSLCKPLLIALIGIHAAAALFHQFWIKDGTLLRMLVP